MIFNIKYQILCTSRCNLRIISVNFIYIHSGIFPNCNIYTCMPYIHYIYIYAPEY